MTVDAADAPEPLNLGLLLFIPYRSMESAVLAHLKAHGHDLPLSQARVFQRIAPDGSRLGELAQAAQVSKQTVGSVVDQLERAGYVKSRPRPDGRPRPAGGRDRPRSGAGGAESARGSRDRERLAGSPRSSQDARAAPHLGGAARDHRPLRRPEGD